jgi:hypothetical protein
MKPTQARIADLWCKLMHSEPMWPSHGQYECRTCGRRHRVCWEQPLPVRPRAGIHFVSELKRAATMAPGSVWKARISLPPSTRNPRMAMGEDPATPPS